MSKKLDPAKLTPETLALVLSNAGQRVITEEQIREIAEAGGLLGENDTISLIHFTAWLAHSEGRKDE